MSGYKKTRTVILKKVLLMNQTVKELVVKPPNISEETMREIAKFFMKTSIPRILAARQKEQER
ncbi:hypothetical protein ACIGC1_10485 [Peribacillus butanolivorans]|uniref:hypothetical protein n=1 Tax=Peribacillus butanolivorans TaxID=421767 RepID=UPI0037CB11B7